jgi:hypothetical protein
MQRRSFMVVLAAGGAVLALPGCNSMPASAIAAWQQTGADQTDPRLRALSWALLAPNPHNLQSWIADIREPGLIRLSVDMQRLLPATDPPNRQILIGCGAFLELLCMAAAQFGQRAEVSLLPEGDYASVGVDARPFATVRMTADPAAQPDPLFVAVPVRRTNRAPYSEKVPAPDLLARMQAAAQRPGITLHSTTDPAMVGRLRALAMGGYRVEFSTPATWVETADAMRVGTAAVAAEPSGIPVLGTKVWWGEKLGMLDIASLRRTDGVSATTVIDSSIAAAEATHAWAWLRSDDNSRRSQIEAGRAYLRTDLAAASLGLAIQPNSQVLQEFPEMAELYGRFHTEVGVAQPSRVQMLVRLGYAGRPDPAPRRPLDRLVRA